MTKPVGDILWAVNSIQSTAEAGIPPETETQIVTTEEKLIDNPISPPSHTSVKPWMDYRAVTDTSSVQYELLSRAYHADNGLLYVDGYLCVALGQQFGEVGDVFIFEMDTGETIEVIMADAKMDCHTIDGWTGLDGHLMEMIVDTDYLDNEAMVMGDCNCLVPGTVVSYERKA